MVNRNIEETLDLVGVQVHGNQTVDARHTQQVGNEFGSDANSWLVLPVLTCPTEVGDYCIDSACRCSFCGIYHE